MSGIFDRTEKLIGKEKLLKIMNSTICIIGLGGVGSYVFEGLVRSGVSNLIIIDNEQIDESNINRQIIALNSTVGEEKSSIAKKRALDINPLVNIKAINEFVTRENIKELIGKYDIDYIVDAIDTIKSKIAIIEYAKEENIDIISCMGTGNKLDASLFKICDISKTSVCPLAKVMRKELKKMKLGKLDVLFSEEIPNKSDKSDLKPASISFVPSVAGLLISGHVIRNIIK